MKIRALLVILLTLACAGAYAQDGGVTAQNAGGGVANNNYVGGADGNLNKPVNITLGTRSKSPC